MWIFKSFCRRGQDSAFPQFIPVWPSSLFTNPGRSKSPMDFILRTIYFAYCETIALKTILILSLHLIFEVPNGHISRCFFCKNLVLLCFSYSKNASRLYNSTIHIATIICQNIPYRGISVLGFFVSNLIKHFKCTSTVSPLLFLAHLATTTRCDIVGPALFPTKSVFCVISNPVPNVHTSQTSLNLRRPRILLSA